MNPSEKLVVNAAPTSSTIPIVDISGLHSGDEGVRRQTVEAIRKACLDKGFLYVVGHAVDLGLCEKVLAQSALFFARSTDEKMSYERSKSKANRGYEPLRGQVLEEGAPADLKEGFYMGIDVPEDDPRALRHFNFGPNVWPAGMPDFKAAMQQYFIQMHVLVHDILEGLALSLDLPADYFESFQSDPLITLRLLHYPPQPANPQPGEKGCGAHTDFGAITLLLQDMVGGLQVWDHANDSWIDAEPVPGAFVVNLGDLTARWTNDRYRSTLHRVINKSGVERYSAPFFFSGNPDHVIECIPTCLEAGEEPLYPPITVDTHIKTRYVKSYS